ncbi:MAG: T9SS type A sorting domain-containing protein [Melioribacteraceae bacterium]|nr:T9SS type A sorting domain-containing protein [Melioribacteraceae bacterium]
MKKTIIFLTIITIPLLLQAQSSVVFDTGTIIDVGTGADISADAITVNGAYSGGGTFNSGALPVELVSFSAIHLNNGVELTWRTATEINNYGFDIQRTANNNLEDYQSIGFIQGHGNSISPKEYSFLDNTVSHGKYFYRLKQIDIDGAYEYSEEIEIDLGTLNKFVLNQNYPNTFNPETSISYEIPISGKVVLKVFNLLGKEVATLVNEEKVAGSYKINFSGAALASGTYFYRIQIGGFVKTKKFILLK